ASRAWPLSVHVAESAPEDEMFRESEGIMHRWLERNQRDMSDCNGRSPVRMLQDLGLLNDRLLAVHCNYLDDDDIQSLGGNQVNVIHCPGSHEYFGHTEFKADQLRRAGANICLGTDSLASMFTAGGSKPTLDLFAEMRRFATAHPEFSPEEILPMVTTSAARALNRSGLLGEISEGADADMIVVESTPTPEAIIHAPPPIRSMIAGTWN
ncbi:MAG: amidohydrolase family protein, partial [Limisphaerales bacterium]